MGLRKYFEELAGGPKFPDGLRGSNGNKLQQVEFIAKISGNSAPVSYNNLPTRYEFFIIHIDYQTDSTTLQMTVNDSSSADYNHTQIDAGSISQVTGDTKWDIIEEGGNRPCRTTLFLDQDARPTVGAVGGTPFGQSMMLSGGYDVGNISVNSIEFDPNGGSFSASIYGVVNGDNL